MEGVWIESEIMQMDTLGSHFLSHHFVLLGKGH